MRLDLPGNYFRFEFFCSSYIYQMYTLVSLGLTEAQRQALLQGVAIKLEPAQFSGNVTVPLTKAQAAKITAAKRGITLKMSGPQQKLLQQAAMQGEGFWDDAKKFGLDLARKGVDKGLDYLQSKVPTEKLGALESVGDMAVNLGRKGADALVDRVFKKFGGHIKVAKIKKHLGAGFFDDLLKGVKTVAGIATPFLLRGMGWQRLHQEIDRQAGEGWFDNVLKGVTTAAQIATPFLLRGSGAHAEKQFGYGWFDDVLKGVKTAADIATPFLLKGRGTWKPTAQKKLPSSAGMGIVLH